MVVLLDAGPLGMITNPKSSPENEACKNWLERLASKGRHSCNSRNCRLRSAPRIAPGRQRSRPWPPGRVERHTGIAPVTTAVMLKAAEFWATARNAGRQSADDASLDADMILAAQAIALHRDNDEAIIATTNVRHLVLFCNARVWRDIS